MIRNKKINGIFLALLALMLPFHAAHATHKTHAKKHTHVHITHKHVHHAHKIKNTHTKHLAAQTTTPPAYIQQTDTPEPKKEETENSFWHFSQNNHSYGFVESMEQRLVKFIQNSVDNLHYSAYKLGGSKVDTSNGIYVVDCSGYVDHTLRAVYPNAFFSLVNSSGAEKPNSIHYYNFFKNLRADSNEYWSKIEDIEELRPGDILVFRYKTPRHSAGGHVMVVMNKPVQEGNSYFVSVADSAPSGHSEDTRQGASGVGIGTLLLKANPKTGQPSAYAWKIGGRWKNNVNFAMGRPLDFNPTDTNLQLNS